MGLLDTVRPILGYVIAIAIVLIIASLGFMAATSTALVSAGTVMAQILIIVALLIGVAAASKVAKDA